MLKLPKILTKGGYMDGIVLIYKEKGLSSFNTVQILKQNYKLNKVGHSGTLDPLAEGLLIALINNATKINEYLNYDKEYEAEITFGKQTSTDDLEGEVIKEAPVPEGLNEKILSALPAFTGLVTQRPPSF